MYLYINTDKNPQEKYLLHVGTMLSKLKNPMVVSDNKDIVEHFFGQTKTVYRKLGNDFNESGLKYFVFRLALPILCIRYFLLLFYWRHKHGLKGIFLYKPKEKIIFSKIAQALKIKVFWIEYEMGIYDNFSKLVLRKIFKSSKKVKMITLSGLNKNKLVNLGFKESQIYNLGIGVKINEEKFQENIFENIAYGDSQTAGKRFFTLGVFTELSEKTKIEVLFKAVKSSLGFIPNLQLLVIGDGKYSPDNDTWIKWLANRLEIKNLVWFIKGSTKKNWKENLSGFIVISKDFNYSDYYNAVGAMNRNIPIIVPDSIGYEDLVTHEQTGLLYQLGKSESLTDQIINLHKNRRLKDGLITKGAQKLKDNYSEKIFFSNFNNFIQ